MKVPNIVAHALPVVNITNGVLDVFNASRNDTVVCFGSQRNVSIGDLASLNQTRGNGNSTCVVLPTLTETPTPSFVTVTRNATTTRIRTATPTRPQPTVTETVTATAAATAGKHSFSWNTGLLDGGIGLGCGLVAACGVALRLKRRNMDKYGVVTFVGLGLTGMALGTGIGAAVHS